MGFVGPNGAGKSTTIRILMGMIRQDRGTVRVLGRRMPDDQAEAKRDIGFVSEDMRLHEATTLAWHMKFMASIYPGWDSAYAGTLLERFNLHADQTIKELSHGERVKAVLLLALARRPRLLLLDEPTTGLDPVARHEILTELMDVVRDERRAILFSSHNTQDVEQISDQHHVHRSRPHHRLERQGDVPRSLAAPAPRGAAWRRAAGASGHRRDERERPSGDRDHERVRTRPEYRSDLRARGRARL